VDRTYLTAAGIVHDVALEVLEDDPYPTYAWMRRHRPVAFVPETGRVWITTWDLCDEAGRNDKVFGPSGVLGTKYGRGPYKQYVTHVTVDSLLTHTSGGWPNDSTDPMFSHDSCQFQRMLLV